MTYPNFRSMPLLLAVSLALWFLLIGPDAFSAGKHLGHPRPSGYAEANAPGDAEHVEFQPVTKDAGFVFDLVAHFP
ncbi:MAG: hypothetical protein HYV26_09030, partial [Candidatus Hydrogenedentes bacterium]|nr:hypothetical protein [Candidatus Hydrogenedentota bacterium]